jgi:hypothetical protein
MSDKKEDEKKKELIKLFGSVKINGRDIPKTKTGGINRTFLTKEEKEAYKKYNTDKKNQTQQNTYDEFVKLFG